MRSPHRTSKRGIREVRFRGHVSGTIRDVAFQRSIRPRERLRMCTLRGVGFEARGAASTALRPGMGTSQDESCPRPAVQHRDSSNRAATLAATALSTCNSARLGIRESVSLQRLFGWVADANHAASSDGPPFGFGRLAPKVALAARCNGRTRPLRRHLRREIGAREPRHRRTQLCDASGIAGCGEGRARAWRQKAFR